MVDWKLIYTPSAEKDAKRIANSELRNKIKELLNLLESDPFSEYPAYKKLNGNLKGMLSRRINIQHRLVYEVYEKEKIVKIIRMWGHYE